MTRLEFIRLAPGRRKDICAFIAALKRMGFVADEVELLSKIKLGWVRAQQLTDWQNDALYRYATLHGSTYYNHSMGCEGFTLKFGGYRRCELPHVVNPALLDEQIIDDLITRFGAREFIYEKETKKQESLVNNKVAVVVNRNVKQFIRPSGHRCESFKVGKIRTFGRKSPINHQGFFRYGCYQCARAYERQFPKRGSCWPYAHEDAVNPGTAVAFVCNIRVLPEQLVVTLRNQSLFVAPEPCIFATVEKDGWKRVGNNYIGPALGDNVVEGMVGVYMWETTQGE